jgi:hypothetical protein
MNNLVQIAQAVGVVSILTLFLIKFYIVVVDSAWRKSGRIAMLWTCMYVFFLFTIRLLSYYHIGTLNDIRLISGFSAVIPPIAIILHLFFARKIDEHSGEEVYGKI